MTGGAVVIARVEVGVVVTSLELETCFENFRWDIDNTSCEIRGKPYIFDISDTYF